MNTTRNETTDPPADQDGDAGAKRAGLEARGYRVALRHAGWIECLVLRGSERWLGRGLTAEEAVDDALAQMLPSALARQLWLEGLARDRERSSPREAAHEAVPGAIDAIDESDLSDQSDDDAPPCAVPADAVAEAEQAEQAEPPTVSADDGPYVAQVVARSVPHLARISHHPSAATSDPPSSSARSPSADLDARLAPAAPAPKPSPPDPRRPSSLARLTAMQRELGRDLPRLARMAPELLRLEMLATICRARAFTDDHPGDLIVERAVGDVARDLTDLGKRWWPGSVRALQLRATPADVAREVANAKAVPTTWADAVTLVEDAQAELRRRADGDAAGWADGRECEPAPKDPVALLHEVTAAIDPKHASEPALLEQARRLRWLRPHLPDDAAEAWADAMGALRRHADRGGVAALKALLEPSYRPHGNWAREAGQDPRARVLKKQRAKLLRRMPRPGATPEVVAGWLSEAFLLGDELPNPKIARHIVHLKDVVLALTDDDLELDERRLRRRLSSLQEMLTSDRVEDADFDDDDEDDEDEDELVDEDDALTLQVRGKASGQRALLLSNRADPDLERRLQESLGLDVTLSLVDTRRRQAAAQAVESGSYELVLAAHRFIGHDVDKDIGQRARAGGIPYVRVGSGRVGSVVRALAREWGL